MNRYFYGPFRHERELTELTRRGAVTDDVIYAAELECAIERAKEGCTENARWVLSEASSWLLAGKTERFTAHPELAEFLGRALEEIVDGVPADKALKIRVRANKRPFNDDPRCISLLLIQEWGTGKPFKSSNKGPGTFEKVANRAHCSEDTVTRIYNRKRREVHRLSAALYRHALRSQDPSD